jgi:hypothetical protein
MSEWLDLMLEEIERKKNEALLGWNAFLFDVIAAMRGHSQLPTVLKACVRPVGQ